MIQQTRIMTIEAFIQQYSEAPFELLDGEIVPVTPTISNHVIVA
jgi:hypothetical protein